MKDLNFKNLRALVREMLEDDIKEIANAEQLLRLNWRLMNLDLISLSGTQVKKIEDSLVAPLSSSNKIGFMRSLMSNGIKTFNVDGLFLQISANLITK